MGEVSTYIKRIPRELTAPDGLDASTITLHLAQIDCPLRPRSYAIHDASTNLARVLALIDVARASAARRPEHPSIIVLPELAVARQTVPAIVERWNTMPPGHVLVAGIDRTTVEDARQAASAFGCPDVERDEFLARPEMSPENLVNMTMVLHRAEDGVEAHLQFKHGPSIYEATGADEGESIKGADYQLIFELGALVFAVVCCSDMFTIPPGSSRRVLDELLYHEWHALGARNPPTLLINHQRTPKIDDERFVASLRHLYDRTEDGLHTDRLCTVMVNHAQTRTGGGGGSSVYVDRTRRDIRASPDRVAGDRTLDYVRAPVFGYRTDPDENVMTVTMTQFRAPRQVATLPFQTAFHVWDDARTCWVRADRSARVVVEALTPPVDHASMLDVSRAMAERQQFKSAVAWARTAVEAAPRSDTRALAEALYALGVESRRAGQLQDAQDAFRRCGKEIDRVDADPPLELLAHRSYVAEEMLHVLRDGTPSAGLRVIADFRGETLEPARGQRIVPDRVVDIDLEDARLSSLEGDMYLQVGRPDLAKESFQRAQDKMGWLPAGEKGIACAGLAHALVLLGEVAAARVQLAEAHRYWRFNPPSRVAWRLLRIHLGVEAMEAAGLAVPTAALESPGFDPVKETEQLLRRVSFRIEQCRAYLALASLELTRAPERAVAYVDRAESLAKPRDGMGKAIRAEQLGLEAIHCVLARADAHRLRGDWKPAQEGYRRALERYEEARVGWGVRRSKLGLTLSAGPASPRSADSADADEPLGPGAPGDHVADQLVRLAARSARAGVVATVPVFIGLP